MEIAVFFYRLANFHNYLSMLVLNSYILYHILYWSNSSEIVEYLQHFIILMQLSQWFVLACWSKLNLIYFIIWFYSLYASSFLYIKHWSKYKVRFWQLYIHRSLNSKFSFQLYFTWWVLYNFIHIKFYKYAIKILLVWWFSLVLISGRYNK